MDQELKQNITDELRAFLNREPTEKEIMNGQTDTNIMNRVLTKKQKDISLAVDANKTGLANINKKIK
jgi:hypothetical protein